MSFLDYYHTLPPQPDIRDAYLSSSTGEFKTKLPSPYEAPVLGETVAPAKSLRSIVVSLPNSRHGLEDPSIKPKSLLTTPGNAHQLSWNTPNAYLGGDKIPGPPRTLSFEDGWNACLRSLGVSPACDPRAQPSVDPPTSEMANMLPTSVVSSGKPMPVDSAPVTSLSANSATEVCITTKHDSPGHGLSTSDNMHVLAEAMNLPVGSSSITILQSLLEYAAAHKRPKQRKGIQGGVRKTKADASLLSLMGTAWHGVEQENFDIFSEEKEEDLYCRINGCRHRSRSRATCHQHRDTHFDGRWPCPRKGCHGGPYTRSHSLYRHLVKPGKERCLNAAGDPSTWGVDMCKFITHKSVWVDILDPWPLPDEETD
ncbi:hypothetical protein BV25DRAFT_1158133 [Artomyces pyxidatus]|uniref:Uncharacterized protein n=1 Tax=Artomyces pyxidatus TaxID=48021 RepID=A0ACB8SRU7_9AGAM|nr:hypothetical protein BV25DRAFT_1158133 [Artomyces pyxidatus]